MNYTVTIGNSPNKRIGQLREDDSEILNSLVILIDRVLHFVAFDYDLLQLVMTVLPRSERIHLSERVYAKLTSDGVSEHENGTDLDLEWLTDTERISRDSVQNIIRRLKCELQENDRRFGGAVQEPAVKAFYSHYGGTKIEDTLVLRAQALKSFFEISSGDARILSLLFLIDYVDGLEDVLCNNKLNEFQSLVSAVLEMPLREVRESLSEVGPLVRLGMIEPDFLPPPHYQLDVTVRKFFRTGSMDVFMDTLRSVEGAAYPLNSFPLSPLQAETAVQLLQGERPVHLLLYGIPGTGKTEFTKALIQHSGRQGFFLPSVSDSRTGTTAERRVQLMAVVAKLDPAKSILVVDEADHFLNSESLFSSDTEKGWITDFIDTSPMSVIWISNSLDATHAAVLRRFTYSLKFKSVSRQSREATWNSLVKASPLSGVLDETTVRGLSREYEVNVGGISAALSAATEVYDRGDVSKEKVIAYLREMLAQHQVLLKANGSSGEGAGNFSQSRLKQLSDQYDPAVLHTDVKIDHVMETAERYLQHGERAAGGTALGAVVPEGSLSILMWGEPGTGKTEFAKYLAEKIDRPLHLKRASALLSKWVGETEQNIDAAFREAEENQALLFLDEADSFFISRDEAVQPWQKTQTNELLTQMENYRGILLCSTNLLHAMDHAVMRRFTWKIRFKPMLPAARVRLYCNVFKVERRVVGEQLLRKIECLEGLTPGDLYTVFSRLAFLGVESVDHAAAVDALEAELRYKRGRDKAMIGFVS